MDEPVPTATREELDELRQHHVGRLLLRAHRQFSLRAIEELRQRGHDGLNLSHTNLLAHLDTGGTRLTTLAERAGVTKQAIGKLVADLESKGYVQRTVDPTDGRATLLMYTTRGWKFLQDAHQVKRMIEAEYAGWLGADGLAALRELLTRLLAAQQLEPEHEPDMLL